MCRTPITFFSGRKLLIWLDVTQEFQSLLQSFIAVKKSCFCFFFHRGHQVKIQSLEWVLVQYSVLIKWKLWARHTQRVNENSRGRPGSDPQRHQFANAWTSTRRQSGQLVVLCYCSPKKLVHHRCLNLVATLWSRFSFQRQSRPWLCSRGCLHAMSPLFSQGIFTKG